MKKPVLFIQGGGSKGYETDKELSSSLQAALGKAFNVIYPRLQTNESQPDFGWISQIEAAINNAADNVIIAAHSLGASLLLKLLSENEIKKPMAGVFLLAAPFWSGKEDWVQGLKLQDGFAEKLPGQIPIFVYHCRDDQEIPFSHFSIYQDKMAKATFREFKSGGHQFDQHITTLAQDIRALKADATHRLTDFCCG